MATNFVSKAKHKSCTIFAIFIPYESVLGVDDISEIFFSIYQGTSCQPILFHTRSFAWSQSISQDPQDRFSQSLHRMVGIELQMVTAIYFFRNLKGRCHGNQFSGKIGQNYLPHALIALSIQNGKGYRDLNCALTAQMTPLCRVKMSGTLVQ